MLLESRGEKRKDGERSEMSKDREERRKQADERKSVRFVSRLRARRFPTGVSVARLLPFHAEQSRGSCQSGFYLPEVHTEHKHTRAWPLKTSLFKIKLTKNIKVIRI